MRGVVRLAAVVTIVVGFSSHARAEDRVAAEVLFDAGRALAKEGDMVGACAKFRESHRLDPAPGTRLNLALCEEELGRLARAQQLFRSLVRALAAADPRRRIVEDALKRLEARVPHVTLRAIGPLPRELVVTIGALELTEPDFGVPIPLDPGTTTIEVSVPGHDTKSYRLLLVEGESHTLLIDPPRPRVSPPQVSIVERNALPTRPVGNLKPWGVAAFGVAASGLVTSLVLGYAALREKDTMNRECDASGCTPNGMRASRVGDALASASTAAFVSGAAVAGVGLTLLLVDGGARGESSAPRNGALSGACIVLADAF